MRRILVALTCLVLFAAALPARAGESPPRSASAEIVRAFEGLWNLLSQVFTRGGDMDPNGLQEDLGGDMDPDG